MGLDRLFLIDREDPSTYAVSFLLFDRLLTSTNLLLFGLDGNYSCAAASFESRCCFWLSKKGIRFWIIPVF